MRRVLALVVLIAACTRRSSIDQLPPYIQPPPGARVIWHGVKGEQSVVRYVMPACYPATGELAALTARIPKEWSPRREHAVNAGDPAFPGWTTQAEGDSLRTMKEFRAWSGQWQRADGAVLEYSAAFRSSECRIEITASIESAETVEKMRRAVR